MYHPILYIYIYYIFSYIYFSYIIYIYYFISPFWESFNNWLQSTCGDSLELLIIENDNFVVNECYLKVFFLWLSIVSMVRMMIPTPITKTFGSTPLHRVTVLIRCRSGGLFDVRNCNRFVIATVLGNIDDLLNIFFLGRIMAVMPDHVVLPWRLAISYACIFR